MSDKSNDSTSASGRGGQPRHRARRWLPYAGILLTAALITAGLWPKAIPVEVGTAKVGLLRASVTEEGKTRIRHRYVVSAPFAGNLRRIPFKAGFPAQAGRTVVAVVDPLSPAPLDARSRALAEARRDTAAANLAKARAAHEFAAGELRRFKKLDVDQTISAQELDSAQWRETNAARELAAAESALRQAEAEVAEFTPRDGSTNRQPLEILAPASGLVLHIMEENARPVGAGTPLLEIGDPTDLEVVIEVLSRDGATITPGTPIELEQWGGGPPLQARARLVEPAAFTKISALGVEEQRVNVVADLLTPPEQRAGLGDNFRVDARIVVWSSEKALKVPAGALFRKGQTWAAFTVENGRARLREVEAGESSGTETQVLNGLKEGETVILYPSSRVQDGARVKVIQL